ncbi:MAG: ATP-binding cassette domain-containing protein, partial [Calditrichaeota bacterium]|nr:ATP-binding cassette domain-containing protein [Calditrichota bacterium]
TIEPAFLNQKVSLLSGGQKQRLNLLRTLALDTDLVLLDEPLNGLDFLSIQRVIAALKEKQQEGKAILMISHNEEIFEAVIPPENSYYLDFSGGA